MVTVFSLFKRRTSHKQETPPSSQPQKLAECIGCNITHFSNCAKGIVGVSRTSALALKAKGYDLNLDDPQDLDYLDSQLRKSGLILDRNDKELLANIKATIKAAITPTP